MGKKLSVVLPSYNEEQMIEKTAKVVGDILSREQIQIGRASCRERV